jgi:hypothetical protein
VAQGARLHVGRFPGHDRPQGSNLIFFGGFQTVACRLDLAAVIRGGAATMATIAQASRVCSSDSAAWAYRLDVLGA